MQAVCSTSGIDSVEGAESQKVCEKSWLAWAAMWSEWTHVGTAEATASCEVLILDVSSLLLCIARSGDIRDLLEGYSLAFHTRLISAVPPAADFPDDLHVPFTEYGEIVMAMGSREQKLVGTMALERMEAHKPWGWQGIPLHVIGDLQREVFSGRCVLVENEYGSAERVVSFTGLKLQRCDGFVLIVLAHQRPDSEMEPAGHLPGSKQKAGELPGQTLQRVLSTQLRPFAMKILIGSSTRDDIVDESARFRIRTKYMRVVYGGQLVDDHELPALPKPIGRAEAQSDFQGRRQTRRKSVAWALPPFSECFVLKTEERHVLVCCWLPAAVVRLFRDKRLQAEGMLRQWISDMDSEATLLACEKQEQEQVVKHETSSSTSDDAAIGLLVVCTDSGDNFVAK